MQAYNVLNKARVKLCYKSNPNYNKLKNYWKLILKNEEELSEKKEYSKYFKKEISSKEIVTYLINTDETFKATYECYQDLLKAIKRISFGYRKFKHLTTRALLISNTIKG